MEPNAAEENLQVIRTLMERSALYRRALAPVMLTAGLLGLNGALAGHRLQLTSLGAFVGFWFVIAAVTILASLLIVRRQALSSAEPFWTPPTRRVTRAMLPPLVAGLLVTLCWLKAGDAKLNPGGLVLIWCLLHGCALHSAGLFSSRGVRTLGWGFIVAAILLGYLQIAYASQSNLFWLRPHAVMGLTFGGLHGLAGIYLYFTEKRGNAQ